MIADKTMRLHRGFRMRTICIVRLVPRLAGSEMSTGMMHATT